MKDTQGDDVPDTIKRTLVFYNALVAQLEENYSHSSSEKEKQIISRASTGDIIKKYKCISLHKGTLGCYSRVKTSNQKGRIRRAMQPLHKRIVDFLNRDDVTYYVNPW